MIMPMAASGLDLAASAARIIEASGSSTS